MAEQNTTTQPAQLQVPSTVKSLIEALIFGAREPLSVRQIQALYEAQGSEIVEPRKIDYDSIARTIEELNGEYAAVDRPYRILQIAGGYQFATMPAYAEWLGRLYKEQTRRKLSQSSIETLAIIAYKQPVTKPEIESIRGVNCDYVLSTLLEKDLATIVGRAPTVGRPLLYGTTSEFLRHFGLNDLNDLPRPREIQEILGDGQFETERRMLEAQQGLDEKKEEEFKSRLPHIPKRKPGLDDDVKIVPRKRTREIKVRPNEEAPEKQTEDVSEVAQPISTPGPSLPDQPEDQIVETPIDSVEREVIPTTGNESEGAIPDVEQIGEPAVDSGILAESLKYIDLSQRPEGQADRIEEVEPAESEIVDEQSVVSPLETDAIISDEPAVPPVEVPEILESDVPAEEVQPREFMSEVSASPAPELPEAARVEDGAKEEVVETAEAVVPEIVSSREERVLEHEGQHEAPSLQQLSEHAHPHQSDLQSKSRWTTWKEKIQGFIKKLFG
jgi:segregation and condensation protein B